MNYNTLKASYPLQKYLLSKPVYIAVIVISTSILDDFSLETQDRYKTEKFNWLNQYHFNSGIDYKLIECNNSNYIQDKVCRYECKETFRPGIFQKTILAIRDSLKDINISFVVRTNLSTYILSERLQKYLENISSFPHYSGAYCDNDYWVGGFGIILDRISAQRLVEEGLRPEWYNQDVPDDVQIGRVLKHIGITCNTSSPQRFYIWDYTKDALFNLENIRKNKNALFIRLNPESNKWNKDKYIKAINMLNKFSE